MWVERGSIVFSMFMFMSVLMFPLCLVLGKAAHDWLWWEEGGVSLPQSIRIGLRKPLEQLRPPSVTELLLSDDGDHILEGTITNFFIVCRKDNGEDNGKGVHSGTNVYSSLEVQTAPVSDGVLPGVLRQLVIEVCLSKGIPFREVAPSWSMHGLWEEAFITNGLRLLQHVDAILVPSEYASLESRTYKEVSWKEKQFQDGPGMITRMIQKEIMEKAMLEGHLLDSS